MPKRGNAKGKEVRIPIKEATAKNLRVLNRDVEMARAVLAVKEQRLEDSLRPLYTEHDIPSGSKPVEVTEKAPYKLVVLVEAAQ